MREVDAYVYMRFFPARCPVSDAADDIGKVDERSLHTPFFGVLCTVVPFVDDIACAVLLFWRFYLLVCTHECVFMDTRRDVND